MEQHHHDELIKYIMNMFAADFAKLAFGTSAVEVLAKLDTEQQTIKVHRADMVFKVRRNNEVVILHIEAQTTDSRDKPMPLRMLNYASLLMLRYEMHVYSMVIYLSPDAGKTDPGGYHFGDDTFGLRHTYQVIRLAELDGASFLDAAPVGLLPFTPLMEPPAGMDTESWIKKCIDVMSNAPVDDETRGNLLLGLSTFGSLAHDPKFFEHLLLEAIVQESPIYQIIMQKGRVEGEAKGRAEGEAKGRAEGEAKGRAEGETKERDLWIDWNNRRLAAEARGEKFTELPPSENQKSDA